MERAGTGDHAACQLLVERPAPLGRPGRRERGAHEAGSGDRDRAAGEEGQFRPAREDQEPAHPRPAGEAAGAPSIAPAGGAGRPAAATAVSQAATASTTTGMPSDGASVMLRRTTRTWCPGAARSVTRRSTSASTTFIS